MSTISQNVTNTDITPNGASSGWRGVPARLLSSGYGYLVVAIVATCVVGSLLSSFFLTGTNLQNVLLTGSVVSVLAVGQFLVIVTAGIDLSVGATAALATVIAAALLRGGMPLGPAVIITLLACTAAGLTNGISVVFAKITPFIATLGMMSIIQGLAFVVQGDTLIVIRNTGFIGLFDGSVLGVPSEMIIFLGITVVFAAVMKWTTFGRELYAIGGNPEAARLSGLPVRRNLLVAYSLSGLLAGIAGVMLAAQLNEGSSLLGQGYELDAIAAAVVGGASLFGGSGNPVSAVLGGLLIGIISNIMNLKNIQAEPQLIIQGLLILVAVYFTSGGASGLGERLQRLFVGRRHEPAASSAGGGAKEGPSS